MTVWERSMAERLFGGNFGGTKEGLIEQVLCKEGTGDRDMVKGKVHWFSGRPRQGQDVVVVARNGAGNAVCRIRRAPSVETFHSHSVGHKKTDEERNPFPHGHFYTRKHCTRQPFDCLDCPHFGEGPFLIIRALGDFLARRE